MDAMAAVSSSAILRISAAVTAPYATVERMTRPLIAVGRWPSRSRRELLASDLASILNAIISLQPATDAAKADTILRALEYKSTWPYTTEQTPALGGPTCRTWGELLDGLIEHAPVFSDGEPATSDVGVHCLPHVIETSFNPLDIVLVWWGPDGVPKRRDFYGPNRNNPIKPAQPYGRAGLLICRSFLRPEMIQIAGEILRDNSTRRIEDAESETVAAPARAATASVSQDENSIPDTNIPETRREKEIPQASSSGRPGHPKPTRSPPR